jgi:hypothetical protein
VLVSFTWGIFVFGEHVDSRFDACLAVGCMILGLLGMAYYSAPNVIEHDVVEDEVEPPGCASPFLELLTPDNPEASPSDQLQDIRCDEEEALVIPGETVVSEVVLLASTIDLPFFGVKWSRRTLGILSAMFSGIYGGSLLVPMKWAPDNAKGAGYLISFAIGASTVNLSLWVIRGLYLSYTLGSYSEGYNALPSMHLAKMWKHGAACGLLWSIGNFFSILSVEFLGEGVGYSVVQASILGWYP